MNKDKGERESLFTIPVQQQYIYIQIQTMVGYQKEKKTFTVDLPAVSTMLSSSTRKIKG